MRKIFAVLLCALLLAGCSGESAKENTEPTVNDGLVEVSLLTKCEHWQDDQSLVTISKEYDDQGNVLRETSGTNSYEYQYENGLCISHTSYYDGQLREISTYEYDDQGRRTAVFSESNGHYLYETHYTYDQNGLVVREEHTRNGVAEVVYTYTYDEQNRMIQRATDGDGRDTYEYGPDYLVVSQYDWGNTLLNQYQEIYDKNGNCLRREFYAGGVMNSYDVHILDDQGRRQKTQQFSLADDQEKLQMESVYTYDKKGNVTQVEHYVDGQLHSKDVYSYLTLRLTPEQAQKLPKQQIIV